MTKARKANTRPDDVETKDTMKQPEVIEDEDLGWPADAESVDPPPPEKTDG